MKNSATNGKYSTRTESVFLPHNKSEEACFSKPAAPCRHATLNIFLCDLQHWSLARRLFSICVARRLQVPPSLFMQRLMPPTAPANRTWRRHKNCSTERHSRTLSTIGSSAYVDCDALHAIVFFSFSPAAWSLTLWIGQTSFLERSRTSHLPACGTSLRA